MRRNWFIAAVVIGIAAIVIAAIAMRLSDDDGPQTTEEWAGAICTSLSEWRASIASIADVGDEQLTAEALQEKVDEGDEATSELVSELKSLGPPDLESGDELAQELSAKTDAIQEQFLPLKQGAEAAASASSPAQFLQELAGLAAQFQALLNSATTSVEELQNANVAEDSKAELQQAFADAPSCQSLRAES